MEDTIMTVIFYYYAFDSIKEKNNRLEIQLQLLQDIRGKGLNSEVLAEIKYMWKDMAQEAKK